MRLTLIDPYLASHHQIRNLNEFLLHVVDTARPKSIDIVTRFEPLDTVGHQDRAIDVFAVPGHPQIQSKATRQQD